MIDLSSRGFYASLNPVARFGFAAHQAVGRLGLAFLQKPLRNLVGGSFRQGDMTLHLRGGTWDAWTAHPGHEPETHAFIAGTFADAGVMFDVGAHCGAFALRHARRFSSIHAFEASRRNFLALQRNASLNQGDVHAHNFAVAEKAGVLELYMAGDDTNSLIGSGRSERVEAIALDDHWHSIGSPKVALLKIDVEGAEEGVIRGATALLASGTVVIAEANDDAHASLLRSLMNERGYDLTATVDDRNLIFQPA